MDGHSRGLLEEVLLPRAVINIPGAYEFMVIMAGRRSRQFDYNFSLKPEQGRKAPGASIAGSFSVLYLCTREFLQSWELLCLRQSWPSSARHSQRLLNWSFSNSVLLLTGICAGKMVRRRGTPRRGAAWEANKAQRRREEELERALALASSILRKKARVEGRAALNSIVERDTGGSREKKATEPVDWFSGCVVEEDPSIGDLICMEKSSNRETLTRQNINSAQTMVDDLPGCVVEEISWLIDQQATDAEQLEKLMTDENATADNGKGEDGRNAPPSNHGGGMHGPLLSGEHLALVFELRSHIADLEHRAFTMGQRLDVLLDELSGTPARRRCHMCMQAFDNSTGADGRATSPEA
jgi:hypothetical protein